MAADIRPQLVQHTEVATKAIRRRITLIREAGFSAHPSEQLLAEVKLWRGAFLSDAGVSVEKLRRITKGQMDWVVDELEKQLQRTTEGTLDGSALVRDSLSLCLPSFSVYSELCLTRSPCSAFRRHPHARRALF